MSNYVVAIPTYNRYDVLEKKSIKTLLKEYLKQYLTF